nr:copia protein [Tanacetum cinerariifolium]
NPIFGVDSASISSSISASGTPPVSAGSAPPMSLCASPIFAARPSISADKSHVFAVRPSIFAGKSIFTGIPVSAGRPSCFATRTPVPVGRILRKVTASTSSNRFPRALSMENSDIHDGLTIFDCPKFGIFTSFSYDKDFSGPDANNLESSFDILKNKRDARGIVCRNKARLVAQGHRHEERIDYTDVFAPVARIEAIRLFLAFASFIGFKVYQIDVKSAFFYGKIANERFLLIGIISAGESLFLLVAVDDFCWSQWLLFTSAGHVIFCWLIVIPAGYSISAGRISFLLSGSWNQFASNITIALICLSMRRKYNFSNMIFNGMCHNVSSRTKFLMYPRFLQIIFDTDTEDTTPYPAPLVTKKFFANMRHYQGLDMPLLAHMLNQGEPAVAQAQPQEVSSPPSSHVVEPIPSTDPMPSPPRQSSPPPILVVLDSITSPIKDDDTGGGSFFERPPSHSPITPTRSPTVGVAKEPLMLTYFLALFPTCVQRIATLEAELKATKILHRDAVVLFAKRIKKLESKLKTKTRKLVLSDSEDEEDARKSQELAALLDLANAALHKPSQMSTPSQPDYSKPSTEKEISLTTLDVALSLSQSKVRDNAEKIIYKRIKKQRSSSYTALSNTAIPADDPDSAVRVDYVDDLDSAVRVAFADDVVSAGGADSTGIFISAGTSVDAVILEAERQELLEQELKQSLDAEQIYLDSLLAQRVAKEQERESKAYAAQSTQRQAELDRIIVNLTNGEWIVLVDQKAIAKMKAKAKQDKPMTPAQQREYMRTFVKNQSTSIYTTGWTWKDVQGLTDEQLQNVYNKIQRAVDLATAKTHHHHFKRSGDTLESSESKKLKYSHSTEQPAELQKTSFVSAGAIIAASDVNSIFPFVSVVLSDSTASSVPAETPIAADVFTTTAAYGSAEYNPVSLALVSDVHSWEIIPTEVGLDEIHVITQADGTVKRFYTLQELMHWAGRADLMVLYGMVSDKYKLERATGIGLGLWLDLRALITAKEDKDVSIIWDDHDQMLNHGLEIDRNPYGNDLTTAIQLIRFLLNQLPPSGNDPAH